MKQKGRITALSQFWIDFIRKERLNKGISAKKLSKIIAPYEGDSLVGQIEYEYSNAQYTPSTLKKALNYFDKNIQDALPNDLLVSDKLQEKTQIPILKEMSVKAGLNSLLEIGYFDIPRLRSEITAFYNTFLSGNTSKKDSDLSAQLEELYNEKKLLKIHPTDGSYQNSRLILFVRNMEFIEE